MFQMLLLLTITAFGEGSMSAEQLAAKHVEAIGGKAWAEVKTIKMTGDYESFSNTAPFTIYRKRPGKYRFEHTMIKMPCVRAYDGEKAWWQGPFFNAPDGAYIPEPQNNVTVWESAFEDALIGYKEKGIKLEAAGTEDFEGTEHHLLKLTYPDGLEETWYLHPKTFLKSFMLSRTYEYGRPGPLEVFYDDYRKVGDVIMPFYVELEWHTRHRLFTIEEVALNTDVEDSLFAVPPAANKPASDGE